jgi:hypothetical protein
MSIYFDENGDASNFFIFTLLLVYTSYVVCSYIFRKLTRRSFSSAPETCFQKLCLEKKVTSLKEPSFLSIRSFKFTSALFALLYFGYKVSLIEEQKEDFDPYSLLNVEVYLLGYYYS